MFLFVANMSAQNENDKVNKEVKIEKIDRNTDLAFGYDFSEKFGLQLNINNVFDKYGILGWQGPGGFPAALNRDGFLPDFVANNPNATFSTQGSMPRAYFLTATYKF